MNRPSRPLAAFAAALAFAACSSGPVPVRVPDATAIPMLPATDFPGLARSSPGFDARSPRASWSSDDRVDFALRLVKGDTVKRWLVRLSPLADQATAARMAGGGDGGGLFEEKSWDYQVGSGPTNRTLTTRSLQMPMTVGVYDEDGNRLTSTIVGLPVDLLARGVLPAIDLWQGATAEAAASMDDEAHVRPLVEATIAMMTLIGTLQENEALADYFWQVVEKPSVLSVITSFGVRATVGAHFEKAVPVTLPAHLPPADRAFVVPMEIDVNGSPALLIDVVAIDAARPFALCGGMIAATARHPSKDVRLEVQIVGARCKDDE